MKETQTCCGKKAFILLAVIAIVALLLAIALWNQLRVQEDNLSTAYLRNSELEERLGCIDDTIYSHFNNSEARSPISAENIYSQTENLRDILIKIEKNCGSTFSIVENK